MRTGPGFNLSIAGTLLFVEVFKHIGALWFVTLFTFY